MVGIHKTNNRRSYITIYRGINCIVLYTDHNTRHIYDSQKELEEKWALLYV